MPAWLAGEIYFAPGGRSALRGSDDLNNGANWKQDGDAFEVDINHGYVTIRGKVTGSEMHGDLISKAGQTEQFSATQAKQLDAPLVAASKAGVVRQLNLDGPLSRPVNVASGFVGSFDFLTTSAGQKVHYRFTCTESLQCEMRNMGARNEPGQVEQVETFKNAVEADRIKQPRLALNFARRNRFDRPESEAAAAVIEVLMPLLDSDTDIERCLDLAGKDNGMLACKMVRTPGNRETIYYFALDMGICRGRRGFCTMLIIPLERVTAR